MSIVIKVEEINFLIYKYLLESGLIHTAFSLFHETNLEKILRDYDEEIKDMKSGLLIHYLERGLMLNQIESHIDMNEYCECSEPFHLIKQHICTIVERKKESKLKEKMEKNNIFIETLKKTTDYQISNPQNAPVIIDDKFLLQNSRNIKLNMENISIIKWNCDRNILSLYEEKSNLLYFWQKDPDNNNNNARENEKNQVLNINGIVPIQQGEENSKITMMEWDPTNKNLLCVLENNYIMVFDYEGILQRMFSLMNTKKAKKIKWSKHMQNIIAIIYDDECEIMDPMEGLIYKTIKDSILDFEWRIYDEYTISLGNANLTSYKLAIEGVLIKYNIDTQITSIKWNYLATLLATFSDKSNIIYIWTSKNENYFMSLSDEEKIVDFLWGGSTEETMNANFMVAATEKFIKVWDIEFGSLKYKHQLKYKVNSLYLLGSSLSNSYVISQNFEGKINIFSLKEGKNISYHWEDSITNLLCIKDYQIAFLYKNSIFFVDIKKLQQYN